MFLAPYEYGQFTTEHLEKIKEGIRLYNTRFYWECHEELEDLWIEDMGDNARYIYWVIIQVATSLLHYEDDNLEGASGMLEKAKKKLVECEKRRVETDLVYKFLKWQKFKNLIRDISSQPKLTDFEELYEFKFSNPDKWKAGENK